MSEHLNTIADYDEAFRSHQRIVREIDVIINGEAGAAKQASLCDLVGQIRTLIGIERRVEALEHAVMKLNPGLRL